MKLSPLRVFKSIVVAIAIALLFWIGLELAAIERLLNKQKTPPQFEYAVVAPDDSLFDIEMNSLGKRGWEIVSARRATSALSSASYEVIMKREVTGRASEMTAVVPHSESPSSKAAAAPSSDGFIDEQQSLYAYVTKTVSAKNSSESFDLHRGDLVLIQARNSKFARIEFNGKTATIPISATDLAEQMTK